jgi:hypothetical protein
MTYGCDDVNPLPRSKTILPLSITNARSHVQQTRFEFYLKTHLRVSVKTKDDQRESRTNAKSKRRVDDTSVSFSVTLTYENDT